MTTRAIGALKPRDLLARILETPHLEEVVQGLEPRVLNQLVRHCGLEDCGEVIALATTDQLMRVFDDDLWNEEAREEGEFDADRFGLWLEVLAEAGASVAAQKLAGLDFDFVTAALSRHVLVLDPESLFFGEARTDPDRDEYDPLENARAVLTESALADSLSHDIGGFTVIAKRSESWDALLSILVSLDADQPRLFGKLMKRCCQFSTEHITDNGGLYEVLTADQQVMADIAGDRERRREEEGHVSASQAVAFLRLSRRGDDGGGDPNPDPITAGYFRELDHRSRVHVEERPTKNTERRVADFLATLQEGGVLERPRPPRLLEGSAATAKGTRLSRIRAYLQTAMDQGPAIHSRRTEELAYLANVLVAGSSVDSRRFRPVEAADAVLGVCNLGLESSPDLASRDLVAVFRTGWRILHEDVCLHVARRLVDVLADFQCEDEEVQGQIQELWRGMKTQVDAGTPWRERENLDVIAVLDQPTWAILLRLVDECPALPRGMATPGDGRRPLRVSTELEFISENSQIAWVRAFGESLPERLLDR